jgi:hypothetical protein
MLNAIFFVPCCSAGFRRVLPLWVFVGVISDVILCWSALGVEILSYLLKCLNYNRWIYGVGLVARKFRSYWSTCCLRILSLFLLNFLCV